jgi:hypothetical protein
METAINAGASEHANKYIDFEASSIQRVVGDLCQGVADDTQKALAIFGFVRDEIAFGFSTGFWDLSASQVLRNRRGYCNNKSTLFVAMLRAAGLQARQVFVDIDSSVLHGVVSTGTPYVDHSYVEVFLGGEWRATDAYIADSALFEKAKARLNAEGGLLGYGVHATGSNEWNGRDPSFSQYNINDPRRIGTRVWGSFPDNGTFYASVPDTWNRLNPILRAGFGFFADGANARLNAIRQS